MQGSAQGKRKVPVNPCGWGTGPAVGLKGRSGGKQRQVKIPKGKKVSGGWAEDWPFLSEENCIGNPCFLILDPLLRDL